VSATSCLGGGSHFLKLARMSIHELGKRIYSFEAVGSDVQIRDVFFFQPSNKTNKNSGSILKDIRAFKHKIIKRSFTVKGSCRKLEVDDGGANSHRPRKLLV